MTKAAHRFVDHWLVDPIAKRAGVATLDVEGSQVAAVAWRDGEVVDLYRVAREITLAISASMLTPPDAHDLLASRIDTDSLLKLTEMSNAYFISIPK